uniref:hypothetical protein n=1 Tax=Streptomyces achromogenes TaxID=67255 RepID=UPI003F491417
MASIDAQGWLGSLAACSFVVARESCQPVSAGHKGNNGRRSQTHPDAPLIGDVPTGELVVPARHIPADVDLVVGRTGSCGTLLVVDRHCLTQCSCVLRIALGRFRQNACGLGTRMRIYWGLSKPLGDFSPWAALLQTTHHQVRHGTRSDILYNAAHEVPRDSDSLSNENHQIEHHPPPQSCGYLVARPAADASHVT